MAKRAGFVAQILSHRVKRSRLCFPCSPAQIQSRGAKRKRTSFSTARTIRTRTAHLLTGSRRGDSVDQFESDPISCGCGGRRRERERDWASLGDDGPACLIAERVLANDVADYVRFRAVCGPWRRCSVDPRAQSQDGGLDGRFHPRQWLMLDKAPVAAGPRRHRFLNVSTGECIRTDLLPDQDLAEHALHAVTPEGLLLLLHGPTLVLRLLNPLTRRLTDLPPATTLVTEEQLSRQGGGELRKRLSVYSAGLAVADADASTAVTVAICFRFPMGIAVAKPGGQRWTLVYDRYVSATLSFAGRFYCTLGSSVMVLEDSPASSSSDHPRLVTAVKRSFRMCGMSDSLHLLDNAGELMLVHRLPCRDNDAQDERYKMDYRVYRVDLDAGALVPARGFNGRAVFMGHRRAVSVPAGAGPFSAVSADTLYLGSDFHEKTMMNKIEAYNVADGSAQPYHRDSRTGIVQPCGVVDCISHCIMGSGKHLV